MERAEALLNLKGTAKANEVHLSTRISAHVVKILQVLIGLGIVYATASFFFTYDFISDIQHASIWYLSVCGISLSAGYFVNAWRWRLIILSYEGLSIPVRSLFFFISGLAACSNALPGRMGEVLKVYVLNRRCSLEWGKAISFIVTERVFDMLVVFLCVSVPLWVFVGWDVGFLQAQFIGSTVKLLDSLEVGSAMAGVAFFQGLDLYETVLKPAVLVFGVAGVLLVCLGVSRNYASGATKLLQRVLFFMPSHHRLFGKIESFLKTLRFLGHRGSTVIILVLSGVVWVCYGLSVYYGFLALHIQIEWYLVLPILGISALGLIVALTPASIGTYELTFIFATLLVIDTQQNPNLHHLIGCAFLVHGTHILTTFILALWGLLYGNIQLSDFRKVKVN